MTPEHAAYLALRREQRRTGELKRAPLRLLPKPGTKARREWAARLHAMVRP